MHTSVLIGNEAAALTSTVNRVLGSRLMDAKTGIILNDEMDDFSVPGVANGFGYQPSPYNFIHPGKRPLSSAVPTIVEKDGTVLAVCGASGGSHIITSTLQTLIRMLDFGEDPINAVSDPRAHHQLMPNVVVAEFETPQELIDGLKERGHNVTVQVEGKTTSGVSAVKKLQDGLILGAGDYRKNGMALGY